MNRKEFCRLLRRGGQGAGLCVALVLAPRIAFAADPFAENVRTTPWLSPAEEQRTFHLPPGFEIQLFAAEPDILKPMNMAFDAKGRLWVTVTQEYPFPAPTNRIGRDMIKVLEDTDHDGRADKITTFADGLNIPIGIYPWRGGCIAWSIPHIWWLEDTDGDGRADKREVLYGPLGWERDTHGLNSSFARGFDGWLYATHGYNNDTTVRGKDGHEVKMNSGNTYRMRLDGSRIEQNTWGQVNPFGLCFDALGNLYSADCHSEPVYQLLRGGYYPSFGKPDDGLGFAPSMIFHGHDSTAICGIYYVADDLWPEEYRDNLFSGNVMTSRVNRDAVTFHGSSPLANARPDFVVTDDPWFRPVNLALGPDGALYVADFYNRIIGHYEVPLNHPGRDRTSGRIWRIVYRGAEGQLKVRPRRDISEAPAEELVQALNDPNLTFRTLATDQLTDRVGAAVVPMIKSALRDDKAGTFLKIHGLWALQRLGALDEKLLSAAAQDRDRAVRVHAMRIFADTPKLSPLLHKLMLAGLKDPDRLVQRCAAEALSLHPAYEHITPLLVLRQRVPTNDTHLLYVVRKALRDQLIPDENFSRLVAGRLREADAQVIADVALGVKSAPAGAFLLEHVQRSALDRDTLGRCLRHAARYVPESSLDSLAQIARSRCAEDPDRQLALFTSIQKGLDQRGAAPSPTLKSWGTALAEKLLASIDPDALVWVNMPLEGVANLANPWFLQKRASADGDRKSLFLCSLPPGGESLTGVLRSKAFPIPPKLTFWLAGHDGFPDKPPQKRNFIRLRRAGTQEVCAEAFPPRNDTAQKVTWDLGQHAGQQGFLEVTDGDTGSAYAWLAVGRFDPPVVPLPSVNPSLVAQRQQAAAELAARLELASLEPQLTAIVAGQSGDPEARAAAARALLALRPGSPFSAVALLLADTAIPLALRDKIGQALTDPSPRSAQRVLLEALQAASYRAQARLAQALASHPEGGEALLQTVAEGKVSPRVLLERPVRDKLIAVRPDDGAMRIGQLTKGLAPAADQPQKLIERRRKSYDPALANSVEGARVFTQNCAACHSLGGQGGNVGPQLDGIGHRGLERLCEDVLDPNRNVDRAFRTTLFTLADGDLVSGLFRREEGELVVLADATGKEITIPKRQIAERRESDNSLMPENFGEIISPEDFAHLLAFLLSKGSGASR
jgi:putative heme-binding domain-containing protein